jgi:alkyl sulfatase BDS1-like metallo-beta-lactamase superfamily hydrolase
MQSFSLPTPATPATFATHAPHAIHSTLRRHLSVLQVLLILLTPLQPGLASAQTAPKDAEPATRAAQQAVLRELPFADRRDFDDAQRGFIATLPDALVEGSGPRPVFSMKPYAFLEGEAPDTVNPSLWRQAQLNAIHGLFKVSDRVYQVRGLDIANMTLVEGDSSLIVIDTLLSSESARAGLELYYQHRPRKPVGTVIYTHSHADHFGGVKGLVSEADVAAGKVQVIAPEGFMASAVAENILAGNAMSRRAQYMYGVMLPPGPRGGVDAGLGKALSRGTLTLIAPTSSITQPMERRRIDGVDFVFQLAPGSEAPSEMIIFMPQFHVLDMAEDVTHTLHNLYTLRGAEVRDARLWASYISSSIEAFGADTEVVIAQHHWPVQGQARVLDLLRKQRDMYKYINDQTLRLLNQGYTGAEIAETLRMPASLAHDWAERGYYGTLSHNAKAVYQKYLGWYDANPANLNPLPPVEAARKTVDYMGGADAVIARAREDFKKGEYRWVASAMNQVVFADPGNRAARELGADALEQLGYQAEAGPWRGAYLSGALELRNGPPKLPSASTLSAETLKAVSTEMFFDYLGVRLDGPRAEGKHIVINWNFTDPPEQFVLNLENSALTTTHGRLSAQADATMTLSRATLDAITLKQISFAQALQSAQLQVKGDPRKLLELLSLLDNFNSSFEIVEPKAAQRP